MEWLIGSQTTALLSSLILAFVFLYIRTQDRQPYLAVWSAAWILHAMRFACCLLMHTSLFPSACEIASETFSVGSGYLLLAGSFLFLGRRIPAYWTVIAAAAVVWVFVTIPSGLGIFAVTLPAYIFIAAAHFLSGIMFLRSARLNAAGKYLVGVTLILWGFHFLDYPFAREYQQMLPMGYILGSLFKISLIIGILLLYFYQARAETAREREELSFFVRNASDFIVSIAPDGTVISANPAALRASGRERPARANDRLSDHLPPESAEALQDRMRLIQQKLNEGQKEELSQQFEIRIHSADGDIVTEVMLDPVLLPDGSIDHFISICRDITERKKNETKLQSMLDEKDVLLKEVHHRVKNNMQIIISLLNMQIQQISDAPAKAQFITTRDRIHTMAAVHETLYRSRDFANIDLAGYLKMLAMHAVSSFDLPAKRITVETALENMTLDLDRSILCGLIANELITNAFKHAFPDGFAGERKISVSVSKYGAGSAVMTVHDSGAGIPQLIDVETAASMGLSLVTLLTRQLGGKLSIDRTDGTSFTVTFPLKRPS